MIGGGGAAVPGWARVVLVIFGLALLVTGYLVLTTWEARQGGVACGAPLDNPGWDTGVPCHGDINRRTAVGWSLAGNGVGLVVVAVTLAVVALTTSRSAERVGPTS
jgi:hypothetical protein